MEKTDSYSTATKCVHSGILEDSYNSIVTPIYQTSTFKFKNVEHGASLFAGKESGFIYTRMGNPTIEALEKCISDLEGGCRAYGCSSGMSAIHLMFTGLLKSGDHAICSKSVYGPTSTLLNDIYGKYNIESSFVDTSSINEVEEALKPNTKLIFIETPGNPTLSISDISELAILAHTHNAKLAVDNTFMSPVLQRPFQFGADYIIHSLTKFLNGHADVVGGVLVLNEASDAGFFRKLLNQTGGVIDPFNAFLVHRGIKTLHLRMERSSTNAMKIAKYLEEHPKVDWVRYPGLESHPQYEICRKQMNGFGGMISFELKDGIEAGKILMDNVEVWALAVSLGGVESLIQHPASMTHACINKAARESAGITDGLVRLSVGIEDVNDLIAGIEAGMNRI